MNFQNLQTCLASFPYLCLYNTKGGKVLTVFAFAFFNERLIRHMVMARFAVEPSSVRKNTDFPYAFWKF